MLDILIKQCMLVDGTGTPAFQADAAVADGRIALIADNIEQEARQTIDARGLHLAPGFIDAHTHSDVTLLVEPQAQSKIRQGVTTEVLGNCGSSVAPLGGAATEEVRAEVEALGVDLAWNGMGEYLDRLRQHGLPGNVVPLIGHNTIRGAVLGFDDVQPTPVQQAEMERVTLEAMEQGARGLSTGLYYPPGYYAHTGEVIGLAKVVAKAGGVYTSHIRSESDRLIPSILEAIEIGKQAEILVEVSHLKVSGYRNWKDIDQLLETLAAAQQDGVRLGCDQYPYHASSTWLASILPYWAQAGGATGITSRLRDPQIRQQLRQDWREHRAEWDNRTGVREWSDILLVGSPQRPEVIGKTVAEVASLDDKDPLETALDLILINNCQADGVWFSQSEENVNTLIRHPLVVIGSDASAVSPEGILGQRNVHPRNYGTFPRVLRKFVREEGVLTLEEAVKKMTSVPAERFGLTDRGVVRQGAWADLVLFDAETVADIATFTDPHRYPEGIPYVLVNGQMVIAQGAYTRTCPGAVL